MLRTLEEVKEEALRRMYKLKIDQSCINAFKNQNKVSFSERESKVFDGILYELDDSNQEVLDKIAELKNKNKMVYHIQLSHTEIGDMWAMLFVDYDDDEWKMDDDDLNNNSALVYVLNGDCSEYGSIGIEPKNGGVSRTW